MSKLTFEYDESGNSNISAFAYNTGHLIENLIKEETNNLKHRAQMAEAKILDFYQRLKEPIKTEYAEYFGIISQSCGEI